MPRELTSTGHCTSGHLFKLQRTIELRPVPLLCRSSHLSRPETLGARRRLGHRAHAHWFLTSSSWGVCSRTLPALQTLATPSRSTTIALTSDETRLVVVNREANTVSIIQVKDAQGNDVAIKLDEIGVGLEPRCVAVHPNDEVAYVTNGISATVSVVDLVLGRVVTERPRGHRAAGLRPDAERQPALCGEPYGGHRIHLRHGQSAQPDPRRGRASWT